MRTGVTSPLLAPSRSRPQHAVDIFRRHRPDHLVEDGAFATDHERLGHAVDTPLDRAAAVGVDADDAERIAVAAEEAAGVVRGILVVDADDLQPLVLGS